MDEDATATCTVSNIPLQKWIHLGLSKYSNVFDIYIDGKLVKTCIGNSSGSVTPKLKSICLHGDLNDTTRLGFDGYTTHLKYFSSTLNPVQIYNIYKGGYGGNFLDSILGSYKMKMSLLKNDQEVAGIGLG